MDKVAAILKLSGAMVIFVAIADGILGMIGYELTISGSAIPNFDWPYLVFMGVIGALMFFFGWRMEKKQKKS